MRVVWTKPAVADLNAIRDWIEVDRPAAANKVARTLLRLTRALTRATSMGRPGRVLGTRELVAAPLPYIVAYRVRAGVVEILRVLHTSRRWPTRLH